MSVMAEQRLVYSVPRSKAEPVTDGTQSVTKLSHSHECIYWAWWVSATELNSVIENALPTGFVLSGEPSISRIDVLDYFNVEVRGIKTDTSAVTPSHTAAHSISV